MSTLPFIATIIAYLEVAKYPLFFLGSYLEGTVVMMTGGVLLRLGQVSFWPLYASLIAGDVLSDIMWYFIGYFGARHFIMRWGHLLNATPAVVEKLERRFHKYHLRILVISKATMGFGLATAILMTAGMLRVSFVRYFTINFIGSFIWVGAIIAVGYFFGNILALIPTQFQIALLLCMIVGFFLVLRAINNYLAEVDW